MLIVSIVYGGPAAAQQAPAVSSVWVNELGSTMTIQSVGTDGLITGTYVTAVGCGAGTVRPLTGWWNNSAMTFTVNWQECNSLTSWTGNYNAGNDYDAVAINGVRPPAVEFDQRRNRHLHASVAVRKNYRRNGARLAVRGAAPGFIFCRRCSSA
jgi:hypothetical protein